MKNRITFSFGKNWEKFIKSINEKRISIAKDSIISFIPEKSLADKTFLDIGCGSGLFSYSAHQLGAKKITSFDIDDFSVKCCEHMYKKEKSPQNWKIIKGSILDNEFLKSIEQHDIVYSWGVLHHTGKMYSAIENAANKVNPNGYLYIAIYNKTTGILGSNFWLKIKKIYNNYPLFGHYILEPIYMGAALLLSIYKLQNPFTYSKRYYEKRGMKWRTDVSDWLGGYPYEFATIDEIFNFMNEKFPKFQLKNIKSVNTLSCNWFLFQRKE